jgi:hypothetical protein
MISEPSTPDSTDPFAHPAPPGSRPRLAILGAGPVGLEAALAAREGGFPHRVYEKARQPAGHVRRWGHVRLFTPWRMNVSERMRRALAEAGIPFELDPEEAPTGHDYADALLDPLWHSPLLSGALHTGTEVVGVTRAGLLKDDAIGSPDRGAGPFRILLRDGRGGSGPSTPRSFSTAPGYGAGPTPWVTGESPRRERPPSNRGSTARSPTSRTTPGSGLAERSSSPGADTRPRPPPAPSTASPATIRTLASSGPSGRPSPWPRTPPTTPSPTGRSWRERPRRWPGAKGPSRSWRASWWTPWSRPGAGSPSGSAGEMGPR